MHPFKMLEGPGCPDDDLTALDYKAVIRFVEVRRYSVFGAISKIFDKPFTCPALPSEIFPSIRLRVLICFFLWKCIISLLCLHIT